MEKDTIPPPPPDSDKAQKEALQSPLDCLLAKHRKELRDLQSKITQKKKNATKKTRRGVNEECERLERDLKERHELEVKEITGSPADDDEEKERKVEGGVESDLVGKVEKVTLEEEEEERQQKIPAPPPPPPSNQPRKPNRAKARIAKRQADLEAQVAEAKAEAATQPNRRATEIAALHRHCADLGLTEQDIPPDGHCLYSAFADQLEWIGLPLEAAIDTPVDGEKRKYKLARVACADYLTKHKPSFEPFLDYDAGEDMDGHIAKVRDTAEWGGQMEVLALAQAYGVVANVVQAEGAVIRMGGEGDDGRKEVWLAYYRHSFGLGEHYNSLRAKR